VCVCVCVCLSVCLCVYLCVWESEDMPRHLRSSTKKGIEEKKKKPEWHYCASQRGAHELLQPEPLQIQAPPPPPAVRAAPSPINLFNKKNLFNLKKKSNPIAQSREELQICICICTYTHTCIYICIYTHTHVYTYFYVCICIHTHVYTYVYIHTHTQNLLRRLRSSSVIRISENVCV
jgi:hypothetical protein